jgi:hypothetical protein
MDVLEQVRLNELTTNRPILKEVLQEEEEEGECNIDIQDDIPNTGYL